MVARTLPRALKGRVLTELRRRPPPPWVPEDSVRRTATVADLVRVAGSRLTRGRRLQLALMDGLHNRFDHGVERALTATDGALLLALGTAPRAVRRARALDIPVVLDVPIGHAGWIRRTMREEALLVPEFAVTLQGHDFQDSMLASNHEDFKLADRLLVLSSHERATLLEQGVDEAKMIYTPLGVDLELFTPQPRVDDGVFRIVFAGQITQRKGLSYLIEAFKSAALPGSELLLVGRIIGSDAPWRATPGVRHLSALPRARLPGVYATADVYILPSLAEGFPLTQMEAMAMGLPVIVSEHTSAYDVVTDGVDGFVVPIRDADAIAERLRALHRDPLMRARMGAAARLRAEQFGWDRYHDRVVEVMRPLL